MKKRNLKVLLTAISLALITASTTPAGIAKADNWHSYAYSVDYSELSFDPNDPMTGTHKPVYIDIEGYKERYQKPYKEYIKTNNIDERQWTLELKKDGTGSYFYDGKQYTINWYNAEGGYIFNYKDTYGDQRWVLKREGGALFMTNISLKIIYQIPGAEPYSPDHAVQENTPPVQENSTPEPAVTTPAANSFTLGADGTIYRLLFPPTNKHLYSTDVNECQSLCAAGWVQETSPGISAASGIGVYRVYNPASNEHLFTADKNECDVLTTQGGWQLDNNGEPIFYGVESGNPVYRLYNPNVALVASHHYTSDKNEIKVLLGAGWQYDNGGNPVYYLQ